jgi:hypothetical protein
MFHLQEFLPLSKPDPTVEQQLAMLVYNSMRTEKYYAY